MGSRLSGMSIHSANQFTPSDLDQCFSLTRELENRDARGESIDLLRNKRGTVLFYENSTRTASSFTMAMQAMGGSVDKIVGVQYSSEAKGEVFADTVRTHACYSHVLVLRHPEDGAAERAAKLCNIPVINAGDGSREHPTQAVLDMFTIHRELGRFDGLNVTLLGDLLFGRTVHALCYLLSQYPVKQVNLVSPEILRLPEVYRQHLAERGVRFHEMTDLAECLPETDVLYDTRVQKERFTKAGIEHLYEEVKKAYIITPETLKAAKKDMIVMHPFPRVNEITMEVDHDPRAAYFRQIRNGLYVRMALLAMVLGKV